VKQLKIFLIRCLFLFYLSSSYLAVNHFHKDPIKAGADCQVCIIVKNLHSGDIPSLEPNNLIVSYHAEPIVYRVKKTDKTIIKGFNANAPPFS